MSKTNLVSVKTVQVGMSVGCLFLALALRAQGAPLTAGEPILLPGTHGGFDFIRMDNAANRLLLGHEGNKTFDVFDLNTRKLLKAIPTSTSQDAAVDVKRGSYYVSGNDPARMVIVDSAKLEVTGEVPTQANTDLIAFNPMTGLVYECNDTAGEVWVIDPAVKKIVATIKVDGRGVEDLAFDPECKYLYQAVKGKDSIAVIDPASNKVLAAWPCAPDKGVHGIAVVPESDGLLVACAGKLVLFNRSSGKVTATATTGARVDEMTYDPGLHTAYCASRQGNISVVAVESRKLTALGDVPDESGTGDIVVDPRTHIVWIAYHKGDQCFVQPFAPAK
ncbi:MAG TPA: YncE family protein [Candidatus Acidoferrum sp.]|nr:YncE family protein [Candidatus Acidoferrum sp.]